MHTRFALVVGAAVMAVGAAFATTSGAAVGQAAPSMVVYKSPT